MIGLLGLTLKTFYGHHLVILKVAVLQQGSVLLKVLRGSFSQK
jgi:hypothetical protein